MTDIFKQPVFLFFDTETTGLVQRGQPEPELVQLAAVMVDGDGQTRGSLNVILEPGGCKIPEAASNVHHITDKIALAFGVPRRSALSVFSMMCSKATHLVAHGFDFDYAVVSAALLREGVRNRMDDLIHVCTMKESAPVLKIPSKWKHGEYKWPKLSEIYQHYFGEEFAGAHDAMADVSATIRVFFEMRKRKEAA